MAITSITYQLSNRQRKELLVRNVPLQIAIPLQEEYSIDPLDFARVSLPDDAEWIVAAEIGDVYAVQCGVSGLTGVFGQIVDYEQALDMRKVPLSIIVVVAQLACKPRAKPLPVLWPAKAFIDGVECYAQEAS
jgi:hypothetical protein